MESFLSRITPFRATSSPISTGSSDSPPLPPQLCTCPPPLLKSSHVSLRAAQVSDNSSRNPDLACSPMPSSRFSIPLLLRFLWFLDRRNSGSQAIEDGLCKETNASILGLNTGNDENGENCVDPKNEYSSSSPLNGGPEAGDDQKGEECFDPEHRSSLFSNAKECLDLENVSSSYSSSVGSTRGIRQKADSDFDEKTMASFPYEPFGDGTIPFPSPSPSPEGDKCSADSAQISPPIDARMDTSAYDLKLLTSIKGLLARLSELGTDSKIKATEKQPSEFPEVNVDSDPKHISSHPQQNSYLKSSKLDSKGTSLEQNDGYGDNACCENGCTLLEIPYTRSIHTKESFSKFLQDASLFDMKVFAPLSFLCDMAYMIPKIQSGNLLKRHRLQYVTSSVDKKAELEANAKKAELLSKPTEKETVNDGNGISKSSEVNNVLEAKAKVTSDQLLAFASKDFNKSLETEIESRFDLWDIANTLTMQGFSEENRLNLEDSSFEVNRLKLEDSLVEVAPAKAVLVAEEDTKKGAAEDLQSSHSCPCEWFVCDDPSSSTRFFVIQGSETLASWRTNLSFEPTKFEGLDILVHRGIYEAGKGLYEQVLPEILAHLAKHGDHAQIRLTGHSLGGSLAIILALMFQIRGVLTSKALLPVVTFGSPCMMCGGDILLQRLKLPRNHIQSIIMHRDIVPRAFSCDYPDHVAHVLKRLNGRFRDHPCLNNQKLLYTPMGQIFVLQPKESAAPPHALLPCGHGLYLLRHPVNGKDTKHEIELRAAQRAFLNMPHPLETLSDPGSYGLNGTISRDHNPSSYTEAIQMALRYEVKRLRRLQREQRRQMMQPAVIAESSVYLKKGTTNLGLHVEPIVEHRSLMPSMGKTLTFVQSVNYGTSNLNRVALDRMSIWASYKNAFGRYAVTIASKHVQVGMLFVVSLRVVMLQWLSTLSWV